MRSSIKSKILVVAALLVPLMLSSNPAFAQQYIAERMLEDNAKDHESNSWGQADCIKEKSNTTRDAKDSGFKLDPRLTPEYWGIEEDTII